MAARAVHLYYILYGGEARDKCRRLGLGTAGPRGTDEEGKGGVVIICVVCSRDRAALLQKLSSLSPRC